MSNMIKMDLYRFFRSPSTWKILLADIMLAFLSVLVVYTTQDNISPPVYSNAAELLAAQISGGMLMALCSVSVTLFVSAKYKDGFIKNIANQLPRREILIFPEIIVAAIACALYFLVYSVCTIATGAFFFENEFITFSFLAISKLLIVQFILHWGFCCLLLLFYILTSSTAFTMAAGLLMAFRILNIFYALIERFVYFNIGQYMLDANIFQIGMESTKTMYTRAVVVGLIFLLAEIALLCLFMRKKDIK